MRTIEMSVTEYDNLSAQFLTCLGLVSCYLLSHTSNSSFHCVNTRQAVLIVRHRLSVRSDDSMGQIIEASACDLRSCIQ